MDKLLIRKDVYEDMIEKGYGKRDLSKLTKKKVTDKNGHTRTVYVRNGEQPAEVKQSKAQEGLSDEKRAKYEEMLEQVKAGPDEKALFVKGKGMLNKKDAIVHLEGKLGKKTDSGIKESGIPTDKAESKKSSKELNKEMEDLRSEYREKYDNLSKEEIDNYVKRLKELEDQVDKAETEETGMNKFERRGYDNLKESPWLDKNKLPMIKEDAEAEIKRYENLIKYYKKNKSKYKDYPESYEVNLAVAQDNMDEYKGKLKAINEMMKEKSSETKKTKPSIQDYMKAKDSVKKLEEAYKKQKDAWDYTQRLKENGIDTTLMFPMNVKPKELSDNEDYIKAKETISLFED